MALRDNVPLTGGVTSTAVIAFPSGSTSLFKTEVLTPSFSVEMAFPLTTLISSGLVVGPSLIEATVISNKSSVVQLRSPSVAVIITLAFPKAFSWKSSMMAVVVTLGLTILGLLEDTV